MRISILSISIASLAMSGCMLDQFTRGPGGAGLIPSQQLSFPLPSKADQLPAGANTASIAVTVQGKPILATQAATPQVPGFSQGKVSNFNIDMTAMLKDLDTVVQGRSSLPGITFVEAGGDVRIELDVASFAINNFAWKMNIEEGNQLTNGKWSSTGMNVNAVKLFLNPHSLAKDIAVDYVVQEAQTLLKQKSVDYVYREPSSIKSCVMYDIDAVWQVRVVDVKSGKTLKVEQMSLQYPEIQYTSINSHLDGPTHVTLDQRGAAEMAEKTNAFLEEGGCKVIAGAMASTMLRMAEKSADLLTKRYDTSATLVAPVYTFPGYEQMTAAQPYVAQAILDLRANRSADAKAHATEALRLYNEQLAKCASLGVTNNDQTAACHFNMALVNLLLGDTATAKKELVPAAQSKEIAGSAAALQSHIGG